MQIGQSIPGLTGELLHTLGGGERRRRVYLVGFWRRGDGFKYDGMEELGIYLVLLLERSDANFEVLSYDYFGVMRFLWRENEEVSVLIWYRLY